MIRIVSVTGLLLLGLLVTASGIWGSLALLYAGPHTGGLNVGLAAAFGLALLLTIVALCTRRWRWRAVAAYLALFGVLMVWWSGIEPSNDRDWHVDMSRLPHVTREGDSIKVHNIRNFDYRSEFDYTPGWYDKSFDLHKLEGVDLVAVYWMGPAIAHIFVSFAFAGGDHLAVSIEARKEKGEGYSTLKGFFRQYELFYVVADERDVIRLRTNYRRDPHEDVYIYRLSGRSLENGRRVLDEYINKINNLNKSPEFYNTLTTNCTTNIWFHSKANSDHLPFSWKILASGYVPEYLYESGMLDNGLPFPNLQRSVHVNARAKAADKATDFSRRIRTPPDTAK
ncbi:MAG: DUF4105 domain-containing protein [Betaproteobacteria bacterium]|nr:MAG: DUF4105 domain-containing protein [Betaproteobacteria bacterium]